MNDIDGPDATDMTIPELVGKIYDIAPSTDRCRMLDYLLKPVGALALVTLCNGVFTKMWFRSGWKELHIRPEDSDTVRGIDVASLVTYIQQASSETIDGLTSVLTTSPMMVYSAAAVMLVTMLARRAQSHRSAIAKAQDLNDSD